MDCDDEECQAFSLCQKAEEGKENTLIACQDGEDNDGDGKKDCDDPDCQAFSVCVKNDKSGENTVETCIDGEDNDKDGKIDCADEGCRIFAFCAGYSDGEDEDETPKENSIKACSDGEDNDNDGLIDCLDDDCKVYVMCASEVGLVENSRELCSDGIDNDINGKKDCEEESCALYCHDSGAKGENTYELCSDGLDNDQDGKMDCEDLECMIFDICFAPDQTDNCKDDIFKRDTSDGCECGQTMVAGTCYTNIVSEQGLKALADKVGNYIIKQPITLSNNFTPITGFKGNLNGGNQRISGVIWQTITSDNKYCGIFANVGNSSTKASIKDIDLAITLNCDIKTDDSFTHTIGGLAGKVYGDVSNIKGTSKVYAVRAMESSSTILTASAYMYAGSLIGYISGNLSNVDLSGNFSIKHASYGRNNSSPSLIKYELYIGGLVGAVNGIMTDVHANIYFTGNIRTESYSESSYSAELRIGGLVGGAGTINNCSNAGNILIKGISTVLKTYYGGLAGTAKELNNSMFTGHLEVPEMHKYPTSVPKGEEKIEQTIGGLVGNADSVTNSYVKAVLYTTGYHVGGLAGSVNTETESSNIPEKGYLVNNFVDITFKYYKPESTTYYYFSGLSGNSSFIINNSVLLNVPGLDTSYFKVYALSSYSNPILSNNFVYTMNKSSNPMSYGITYCVGNYLYESYWNNNIFAWTSASSWVDNTNETYTFNAEGIPVINDNTSVLSLLRFNSGHDGGVISTNIPERFKTATYDDWKAADIDGYKIPVPESAYNLINN